MFIHDAILEATTAGGTEVERERISRYVEHELGEIVVEAKGPSIYDFHKISGYLDPPSPFVCNSRNLSVLFFR